MKGLCVALSATVLSAAAMAESAGFPPYTPKPGPRAGDWEGTLTGTGRSTNDFDSNSFGAQGSIGYYYTKNVPLTFKQDFVFADPAGGSSQVNARTVFQAAYQWDFGRWQPYLGLNLGAIYGAGVKDDGVWGPELGLKAYVNESTFVFGNVSYEWLVSDCCDHDDAVIPYNLGIGFNF